MSDEEPPEGFDENPDNVIALRHPVTSAPIVVPRDVALRESRHYQAYQDRLNGMSLTEIAAKHGYADERAAQYDLDLYVESARAAYANLTVHKAKALRRAQLERLLMQLSPKVAESNMAAIAQSHSLVISLIKLDKLDQTDEDDNKDDRGMVVIDGESEDAYVASLERATKD